MGGQKCDTFLSSLDRDPHPTCTRCRDRICAKDLLCDICKDWSWAQWEAFAKKRSFAGRKRSSRPSGSLLPPAPTTSPRAGTSSEVTHPAAPSSSSSLPSEGGWGGLGVPLVLLLVGLPLLPLGVFRVRGVEVPLDALTVCASVLLSPLPLWGLRIQERLVRGGPLLPAPPRFRLALRTHHCMLREVMSWECLRKPAPVRGPPVLPGPLAEKHGGIVEPAPGWIALVTGIVVLALAPLPVHGLAVEGAGGGVSSRSPSTRERPQRNRSWSLDRYRSRRDRSRRDRSWSSDCCRSRQERSRFHVHQGARRYQSRSCNPYRRSHDHSWSRDRSLLSSDRSRSRERSWRTRRERLETVAVSQAPVVSEASAAVALPVERGAASAFPPAVQDLARFFLSLTGSSSQGAVVGGAGAIVSASGAGVQLCPSAPSREAATFGTASAASSLPAGPPPGVASVPGPSGRRSHAKESSC